MQIITLNLNGIRSAASKGAVEWLLEQSADVICLQEVRAQSHQFPSGVSLLPKHQHWHYAERPGYSGVGLLSKKKPQRVTLGFGSRFDLEGRLVRADFQDYTVISVYVPSGSSGEARQAEKMVFLAEFLPYLAGVLQEGREVVVCGDFNIAHRPIDLKNWKSNQKNSGFLPEERAWVDRLLEAGYQDTFRQVVGETEHYSWWSARGSARANNVGWRLDYQFSSPELAKTARRAQIHSTPMLSDHAPVAIDYKF